MSLSGQNEIRTWQITQGNRLGTPYFSEYGPKSFNQREVSYKRIDKDRRNVFGIDVSVSGFF